jgi:NitT/TauT family transport system permease protein
LASTSGRWSAVLLPSPRDVLDYLIDAGRDGTLAEATLVTLKRLLVGYAIGIVIGIPVGLMTSTSQFFQDTIVADAAKFQ